MTGAVDPAAAKFHPVTGTIAENGRARVARKPVDGSQGAMSKAPLINLAEALSAHLAASRQPRL